MSRATSKKADDSTSATHGTSLSWEDVNNRAQNLAQARGAAAAQYTPDQRGQVVRIELVGVDGKTSSIDVLGTDQAQALVAALEGAALLRGSK
jgi:hypothetical protein